MYSDWLMKDNKRKLVKLVVMACVQQLGLVEKSDVFGAFWILQGFRAEGTFYLYLARWEGGFLKWGEYELAKISNMKANDIFGKQRVEIPWV